MHTNDAIVVEYCAAQRPASAAVFIVCIAAEGPSFSGVAVAITRVCHGSSAPSEAAPEASTTGKTSAMKASETLASGEAAAMETPKASSLESAGIVAAGHGR